MSALQPKYGVPAKHFVKNIRELEHGVALLRK
jgi:hypothetical protein